MMWCRLIVTAFVAVAMGDDDWIDPFSMDLDMPQESEDLDVSQLRVTLVHYKRSLNLLLNALLLDERSDGYVGKITVDLSRADYDFVKEFAMGESAETDFNKLDAILTQVYTRSVVDDISDFYLSWTEYFYFLVTSRSFLLSIFVVFSSSFAYRIWRTKLSLKEVLKYILFVMWIVDFVYCYFKLVQQNEIEKMVDGMKFKSMPAECNPSELSTFTYIRNTMLGDKTCEKFMKNRYSDIYLNVNPLKIFATQIGEFVKTPAPMIGESLGLITSNFVGNLTWFQTLLAPIILYFSILSLCTLISLFTGKAFALKSLMFSFHSEGTKAVRDEASERAQIIDVKIPEVKSKEQKMAKKMKSIKNKEKATAKKQAVTDGIKDAERTQPSEVVKPLLKSIEAGHQKPAVKHEEERGAGDGNEKVAGVVEY